MEQVYNKLVRDKIPEIIESNNEVPITRILNDKEYKVELERKLYEEYREVIGASGMDRIEELADMCSHGWLSNKAVIFGTCQTLSAAESRIQYFMQKSGACLVAGYRKTIDFTHSSLLDIGLITELIRPKPKYKSIKERMNMRYYGLMDELGMIIYE